MGMVDNIFTHDRGGWHVLIVVTPVDVLDEMDKVLGLHKIVHRPSEPIVIGLNAVRPEKLYIINTDDQGTCVWVEWKVDVL